MGVSAAGIRYYLDERELKDWRTLKTWRRPALMRTLRDVITDQGFGKEAIDWKTKPWLHQLATFVAGALEGNFFMSLDMGTGKTKIYLDWYHFNLVTEDCSRRALAIVPSDINLEGWEDDARVHSHYPFIPLVGSTEQKWDLLDSSPEQCIVGVTYPGLMHMLCNLVTDHKSQKNRMQVSSKLAGTMLQYVDCLLADETHEIRNWESLHYQSCMALSSKIKVRYGGTGTPFGRNPADLWSQFHFVDHGDTLGSYSMFRNVFFNKKVAWGGWNDYKFDRRMEDDLFRILGNRSLRYEDWECSDLPPIVEKRIVVPFTKEAYSYYKPANKTLQEIARGKSLEDTEVEASFIKLRQVCSGFLYAKTPTGRSAIRFSSVPKLDALVEFLHELPEDEKMLVFFELDESRNMLRERLTKEKITFSVVDKKGGKSQKIEAVRKFKKDPKIRVLLSHWKSAGVGGNFQMAKYLGFYESPVSPIYRKQCVKRVQRPGQKADRVFIVDFVTGNSVEIKILDYLKEGEDLFSSIITGTETLNTRVPLLVG